MVYVLLSNSVETGDIIIPTSAHRIHLQGILSDLFPGVVLPEHDYGVLQSAIETATSNRGLQIVPQQVHMHGSSCKDSKK